MSFRQQEIETENFTPRPYQLECLEKAKRTNVIIPLGTGTGKTFIAVMLIREMAADTRIPLTNGGKRSFFLVNTVPLVKQQADEIRAHTDLNVSEYHGGRNTDRWTSARWETELKDNNVLVMTAQIFLDLLNHGFFRLDRANVIVFDECHHATKNHPYREIMREYAKCPEGDKPRILGLTASVLNKDSTPQKLEGVIYALECALSAKIETTSDLTSAAKYGAKPEMVMLKCKDFELGTEFKKVRAVLQDAIKFCDEASFNKDLEVDPRKPVILVLKRVISALEQLGPWCAWRVCNTVERQLVKFDKYSMTEMEQLFILMGQTTIRKAKQILDPFVAKVDSLEEALKWLPGRVHRLLECLRALNPRRREQAAKNKDGATANKKDAKNKDDSDFSGLIFVEQRYIAKVLKDCLKRIQSYAKDDYGYLKIDFIVGYSGYNVSEDDQLSLHKRQEEVLKNFRQKTLNLLVATSVVEEGVDIRQCNCVIRFDPPNNFTSYVQSRGRARKANAKYVFLIEEKQSEIFQNQFRQFARIEEILLNHCRSRQAPPKEDIDMSYADHILPPYCPPAVDNEPMEGRPRVTMSTAIPLINRYCAKLPSDVFTRLAPRYTVKEVVKNGVAYYQGSLILPINSPVKEEICGPLMPKQKYAQMATALEACKVLHQRQELDRHLLPVGKESAAKFLIEDDEELIVDGRVRPGSTKRKQYYSKKIADAMLNARPTSSSPNYLHLINMELINTSSGSAASKSSRLSFDPAGYARFWGILSKKPMPKIPSFPVYARQGQLRVQIASLPFTIQLDDKQLASICEFHQYLFSDILRLDKFSMKYDPMNATNALFIVPLKKVDENGYVLDFPFLDGIGGSTIEILPRMPTDDEREKFEFIREKYLDAVVMPWYRNSDQPSYYYVTEVVEHLKPSSPFPDSVFSSFNEYFMQKYGLYINNQDQRMLDVDYTASRLNLTLPRYVRRGHQPSAVTDKNSKQDSTATLTQKQLLAPELVDIHPIPASLWSMIVCLPTVLYRVNSLLVADEWRRRVEKDAFGREAELSPTFEWDPLTYGWRAKGSSKDTTESDFVDDDSASSNAKQQNGAAAGTSNGSGEDGFEIGVWDPTLASSLVNDSPAPPAAHPPNGLIADQRAAAALSERADTSANDDDFDDEDEIYFDVEIGRRFMNLERRATTGGANGETRFVDPFAPSANIVPTGWDAATDSTAAGDTDASAILGLSFLSSAGQFDANALLNDIAKFGVNTTRGPSTAGLQQTQVQQGTFRAVANSGPTAESMIDDVWGGKSSDKASAKKQPRKLPMAADFDDTDEKKVEEALDLADVGITEEDLASVPIGDSKGGSPPPMAIYDSSLPTDALSATAKSTVSKNTTEKKSTNLIDFGDDDDVTDSKQAAQLTDSVFSPMDEPLLTEAAPIEFQVDDFETKPYGPSPCLILQALTMSNANDGFNLERLETVGDSFLKYAVTSCLFNACPDFHEGKLSFLRSKHVSNYNLYKLGKRKGLGDIMIACKFEPSDNWLPPGYSPLEKDAENERAEEDDECMERVLEAPLETTTTAAAAGDKMEVDLKQQKPAWPVPEECSGVIPYNLLTQHSIPDKSIADAVEAMIGVYLLTYGPTRTIQFLKWLGLKPAADEAAWSKQSRPPLLHYVADPTAQLRLLWQRFNLSQFEHEIGYVFKDKAYLVQAFTHASYYYNRVTDCYQRLEFLGDAVLDYMITRHLFEDKRQHSPGVLTDLRSALVNNTIFASLAVKYKFHKYFMALCPGMTRLMTDFVKMIEERQQESNFDEELYLLNEEDVEDEEDIEVPKALGDMFESVAGAIYLDSGGSLDAVWSVYYRMMKEQIEKCCANPPKSPIRELLELEPEKAKFAKLERDVVECKVRVTVDVYGKGRFVGMGRNYRIAKCTAAKRALKFLKLMKAREGQEANGKH